VGTPAWAWLAENSARGLLWLVLLAIDLRRPGQATDSSPAASGHGVFRWACDS
jgi:hypothetical protein